MLALLAVMVVVEPQVLVEEEERHVPLHVAVDLPETTSTLIDRVPFPARGLRRQRTVVAAVARPRMTRDPHLPQGAGVTGETAMMAIKTGVAVVVMTATETVASPVAGGGAIASGLFYPSSYFHPSEGYCYGSGTTGK